MRSDVYYSGLSGYFAPARPGRALMVRFVGTGDQLHYVVVLCRYCDGTHHTEKCPRVEEIEYYPDGSVKWVKLREPETWVTVGFPKTTAG